MRTKKLIEEMLAPPIGFRAMLGCDAKRVQRAVKSP
jgi:hypothetical protein